jgi:hypothetical protein
MKTTAGVLLALAVLSSVAAAQGPYVQGPGMYAYGGYGGYSPYGGYGGYGPYGGYGGYGSYGGYGGFYGGYGAFRFSQGLYQQQAALTQQIFQQQQLATIGQIRERQATAERLDGVRQQLFEKYLSLSDTDKAAVRAGLMSDYLNLDPRGKAGWQRDAVVQVILGQDLPRLDALAQVRELSEPDKARFRQAMVEKFRSLSAADQQAWQKDQIVEGVLGKDWWLK